MTKTMNKEQDKNKLVWKYFWEQKIDELKTGLLAILIIGIVSFMFYLFGTMEFKPEINWQGYTFLVIVVLGLLGLIAFGIIEWIKSNWQQAKKRVEQETCKHKWDKSGYCDKCKRWKYD